MDDAYANFIAEVMAGGFAEPPTGQWSAEQIAAHVACNQEALIGVTEQVLRGEQVSYDNHEPVRDGTLERYAASYGGLLGLADRVAVTATTLRQLASQLDDRGLTEVPVVIRDGGEVVIDQQMPWAKVLEIDETVHVPNHLAQLRALRTKPATAGLSAR